jgi:methionyl-tRNA formyltransferase
MAGDAETGVMVMRMEEGLDTGPIAMAERVPIAPDATAGDLHDRLARLGADLMVRALGALERGTLTLTPQPEAGAGYASKIDKDETRIAWDRPWLRCTTTSAACRHFLAPGASLREGARISAADQRRGRRSARHGAR